jgi:hypothetical protein
MACDGTRICVETSNTVNPTRKGALQNHRTKADHRSFCSHFEFTFSVRTQFPVPTGKRSEYPRGMPLVTRMHALKAEQRRGNQWHSQVQRPCPKTRTVQQPQPKNPNPNKAESMV